MATTATGTALRQLELLQFFRGMSNKMVDGLSDEQLLKTPEGISNNIAWNIGHILFYECVFLYGQCGQELPVPDSYGPLFKGGSSPTDWTETPDVNELVERYKTQGAQTLADFKAGKFDEFNPMKINDDVTLNTIEEGAAFHLFHEGLHVGRIGTLTKLV